MPHNVGKGTRLSTTESLVQALRCLPRKKSILCACLHADLKLQASLLLFLGIGTSSLTSRGTFTLVSSLSG